MIKKNEKKDQKEEDTFKEIFNLEQRIIHILLIKSCYTSDWGLLSGKAGLILFFFHYYKYTNNSVYEDTANNLLEEVYKELHNNIEISFSRGLCGIGWGLEYLIQEGFVEGNSFEVCEDINKKIMEKDPRRYTDYSLDNGLCGLLHYVVFHIAGCLKQGTKLSFDNTYLHDLYEAINSMSSDCLINKEMRDLIDMYNLFYIEKRKPDYTPNVNMFIADVKINETELNMNHVGLKNGLSGFLFKLLNLDTTGNL